MNKNDDERTSFVVVMGESPQNKVLDFLIENDRESWTIIEMSENTGLGYSTLKKLIPHLLKKGLIKVTKIVGKAKLYSTNKESSVVKQIYRLYQEINNQEMETVLNG